MNSALNTLIKKCIESLLDKILAGCQNQNYQLPTERLNQIVFMTEKIKRINFNIKA